MTDVAGAEARRALRARARALEGGDQPSRHTPVLDGDNVRPEWMADGACHGQGPGLFFAPYAERVEAREVRLDAASAVCDSCAVRDACLGWALKHRIEHGFWGGRTARERRRLLRGRRSA